MANRDYRHRTIYRVKRLYQTLRARVDEALEALDLSMPQYGALAVLHAEDVLSNTALARLNFVTPQTMLRIVSSLEAAGLIERDVTGQGRQGRLKLSGNGRAKIEEAHVIVNRIEQQMLASLAADEAAIFHQGLDRSADALSL